MYPSFNEADILEDTLQSPDILTCLLKDHTRSTPEVQNNIFWATDDYTELGAGYGYHDPILPGLITGERGHVVMPRVKKQKHTQTARSREMAEVFTPSWVCNAQNNLIDEAWFGRSGVFNEEVTLEDGRHTWRTTQGPITFPEGKTWCDYIHSTRLEITCGEAPYIVSRYDTTTGQFIPLPERIGLLDRKLRVVSENVHTSTEWLKAAQSAYRHIYAYEWQGDSLLLAREAMLVSFIEYYLAKFGKMPQAKSIHFMAYIISWNVWQMSQGRSPRFLRQQGKAQHQPIWRYRRRNGDLRRMQWRGHPQTQRHLLPHQRLGRRLPPAAEERKENPVHRPHQAVKAHAV